MNAANVIIVCFLGLLLISGGLIFGLWTAVQRGGRKVEPINPEALIIDHSVAAGRFISLEGAYNFRDLGGYRTRAGQRVRWGRVFRSDELSELTDADLETLGGMGLKYIIDLRSPLEVIDKMDQLPTGSQYLAMPIYKREPVETYLPVMLFRRHALPQALAASYFRMIENRATAYGAVLRLLANEDNLPLVYHCTAGKDRTGIVTTLLLSLLGVPEETIIADYSLSNRGFEHYYNEFVQQGRMARFPIPNEEVKALFIVHPDWMRNLLAHLKKRYGGVENYLLQKAGLNLGTLDCIRENLLE